MHTYKAIQQTGGEHILFKDGRPTSCHKIPPTVIPKQTKLGGMEMGTMVKPCNTNCPFAEIKEKKWTEYPEDHSDHSGTSISTKEIPHVELIYEIGCEGYPKEFPISAIEGAPKQPTIIAAMPTTSTNKEE